ncbi:restriction endonuclease subunit S [Rhodobacteraceae bacterium 2CG4]|uniref:Restriction endonuclease subunit S n=1 Tax=Halovulum marinum TaxID=2662447 RepID=A0A6L5Z839_9RHOB|nr:restriction endonuclease subunit S [Halovulum marinum]MSU92082.1 restriction endonuclease subunit S [Halovulum marinum]
MGLASSETRRIIEGYAKSTRGVNNVNSSQLSSLPIPALPIEQQHKLVRRVEAAFARIDRMVEEATRAAHLLDRLDQRLLAKAFRGELVPQDPTDEPADQLLARIQAARAAAPKPQRGRRTRA